MKRRIIFAAFAVVFSISTLWADELSIRLMQNCIDRAKLNGASNDRVAPECLVKLENMVAQQGSEATAKEYFYVWFPQEPMQSVSIKLIAQIIRERKYNPNDEATIQKAANEVKKLFNDDDYKTLGCLYIGKPNIKCLK